LYEAPARSVSIPFANIEFLFKLVACIVKPYDFWTWPALGEALIELSAVLDPAVIGNARGFGLVATKLLRGARSIIARPAQ